MDAPNFITASIADFSCRDKDVESFLKRKAFDFEKRNKSRTYLIFSDGGVLLGYFTLSLKALSFREDVSKSIVKSIDGFSKDVRSVGAIIIGQFGKDMVSARGVTGSAFLELCLKKVYEAHKIVGGRFVMLECADNEKIVSFYRDNGFRVLQRDERDSYLQMVRRL